MQGVVKLFVEVEVTLSRQSLVLVNALLFSLDQGLLLYVRFELGQDVQFFLDWRAVWRTDHLLATWAVHEAESDTQGAPFVLQQ